MGHSGSGKSYTVTRENVENNFLHYHDVSKNGIDKDLFNKYLEEKINDIDFINNCFNNFISI